MKIKQFLILFICLVFGHHFHAQKDSVFLSIESKLITEIEIIIPHGENATRESYTSFKGKYWLNAVDTVSMSVVNKTEQAISRKKQIVFDKVGLCDSIINTIRNKAKYEETRSEINKIAYQEIGGGNEVFNNRRSMHICSISSFTQLCQEDFNQELATLREQMISDIQFIKQGKIDRYYSLKSNPTSISSDYILTFLRSFDPCENDFKSVELIILNQPERFVTETHKLSIYELAALLSNLNNFPEDVNISEMKARLKNTKSRSKRKRKLIRNLK